MASLNWVHLSTSSAPLPLPEEKFLLTIPSVALTLFPCPPGAPTKPTAPSSARHATGNVFVSNQRVVFVASTATAGGSLAGGNASVVGQATAAYGVQTLSMPFQHFLDGRYVQPWFAATYYEALLLPVEGGGLEGPHMVQLAFKESGGFQFYETVTEMKERIGNDPSRSAAVEPLPLYSPPPPISTSAALSTSDDPPLSPTNEDMEIAGVVHAAEQAEERRGEMPVGDGEGPPGYVA